jgi:hypothetical protein
MMTQDRDYEDALRRALTAAAESIEPAGDGLQRIRHRLDSPRRRSILSGCTEWLELRGTRFLIRLEPVTEAGRTALGRSGPLAALLSFLRGLLSPRAARRAGRAGGHRGTAGSPGRLGPAGPWLKPVFAVSAAVAIVVVGVVILNHETGTLISPLNSVSTPSSPSPGIGGAGRTANSKRWVLPLGIKNQLPSGHEQYPRPKNSLPVVACTPTPTPTPAATTTAPAGSPSPSPTPTPSGTTSSSPATPQPSETGQPSPSPTSSPATSAATATTTAIIWRGDAGGGSPIVECGG